MEPLLKFDLCNMKRPAETPRRFQTHIKEPRWQQVASIALLLLSLSAWVFIAFVAS